MTLRPYAILAALFAGLTLSACQSAPPAAAVPEISFAHLQPFALDVAQVEVSSAYQPRAGDGHIEQDMALSPMQAARIWADQRLRAVGSDRTLRVIVTDASVVREELETDRSLSDYFRREQSERYIANLEVEAQLLDERQLPLADITARASRSRTLPEDATIQEREDALFAMTANLVDDLNAEMEKLIPQYFGRWLR